jgi:outer membrane protein assembly factor BamB
MRRVLLAGAILLAGCSGPSGPKMAELASLASSIPVRAVWSASVGKAEDAILFPALAGGAVFAGAQDGTVARFDAATGQEAWRVNVGETLSGGVGSDGSLVAVGTFEGDVVVLDAAKGGLAWKARVSSEVLSAPVVTGDLVIVRTGDGRLFALDARTAPLAVPAQPAALALARGHDRRPRLPVHGFAGGKLVSIALANGAVRWGRRCRCPRRATELSGSPTWSGFR